MGHPEPAGLWQAAAELRLNPVFRAVAGRPGLAAFAVLVAALPATDYAPAHLALAAVAPTFVLVVGVTYLVAQWAFSAGVRARRPRCPGCRHVVWQVGCGRCGQPVPVMALLLGGVLLRRCPHCGGGLADADGTLVGSCHTCSATIPHPRAHLRRPGRVEIELGTDMPPPPAGWRVVATDGRHQELHRAGPDGYTILFRLTPDAGAAAHLPAWLLESVTGVWVGRGVNAALRVNVIGAVPLAARRGAVLRLEDADPGSPGAGWGAIRSGAARPDRRSD